MRILPRVLAVVATTTALVGAGAPSAVAEAVASWSSIARVPGWVAAAEARFSVT